MYATATIGPVNPIKKRLSDIESSVYIYQRFLMDTEARLCDAYMYKFCDMNCIGPCKRIKANAIEIEKSNEKEGEEREMIG